MNTRGSQGGVRAAAVTSTLNRRIPRSSMCPYTSRPLSMGRGGTQPIRRTIGHRGRAARSCQASTGGSVRPSSHLFGVGDTATGAAATSISTSTSTIGSTSTGGRSDLTGGVTTATIAAGSDTTTLGRDGGMPNMTFVPVGESSSIIGVAAASEC
jgi:hypothetical protein